MCEYRGSYVRLSRPGELQPDVDDVNENPSIAEIVPCLPWRVSRSHDFQQTQHVNLQELTESSIELRMSANKTLAGRLCNGTDSLVSLGA